MVSPLHFSRRPGQENKPSPRGPAECHSQCVPASTIPDILASHPFQSKERSGERCWLPHCRASILVSRIWLRLGSMKMKRGRSEREDDVKKKNRMRRWWQWRGTEEETGEILKRWLFVIRSVLGEEKKSGEFRPLFLVGKQQSGLDKWTRKFMPLLCAW